MQCCQLSQIIWETPEFEPFLHVSKLESEISRLIAEVCNFWSIRLYDNKISNIFRCLTIYKLFTLNVSSETPVCHCTMSNNVIGGK